MIIDLPDNLRKTVLSIIKLGEATAGDVAKLTGRDRSTESYYLNMLTNMNLLRKKRIGRKIYYELNF